jgi:O-antigen/teichoic acid export membrane protein
MLGDAQPATSAVPSEPDLLATSAAGPAIVRGGSTRAATFLVGAVVSAAGAALLSRHLGPEGFGTYVLILSLVSIVAGFSDLGLTAVGVRDAAVRSPEERTGLLRDLLGLRLTLTVAGVAVTLVVSTFVYSSIIVAGVAIAGVGLLLQVTQDNYAVLLQVQLRLGSVATLDLLRQLSTAAFVVVFVLVGAGVLPFVAIQVLVGILCVAAAAAMVRGQRSLLPAFRPSHWRTMIADILPFSAAVAAASLYFRLAVVITSIVGTAEALGLVSGAFRIIEVLSVVPTLLAQSALPVFAHAAHTDRDRLAYAFGRVFEVALIVGAWVAVSLAVGASLAVTIVLGHQFADAVPVLQIMGLSLGATFIGQAFGNALLSLRLYHQIMAANIGALVITAPIIAVLVSVDGATGAAIGLVIGEVGLTTCLGVLLVRARPEMRPPLRVVPRVMLAAAVGVLPLWVLDGLPDIVRLVISTILYGAVLILTRALPPELDALLPPAVARHVVSR